ncbi:hypothetical protein [Paraburkholderia xenovorans]
MRAKLDEASRSVDEDRAQCPVRALCEAGIESYFTDYRRSEVHVERFPQ